MKHCRYRWLAWPVALAGIWLWGSIYEGREFSERHFFVKHRPDPAFFFRSPLGEGDMPAGGLRPDAARAEAQYVEFVEKEKGHQRSIPLP